MQYAEEALTPELEHEINTLLDAYYEATVAKDGIPQYNFDWLLYEYLAKAGTLFLATARDGEQLVGLALYHVLSMPHHRGHMAAECDSISTAHTHRGQGIGKALYQFCEPLLIAKGVDRIINRYRKCYDTRPMFESLGFQAEEVVYVKRVR